MAVEREGGEEKQFEDEMQAWQDNHIHDDNDDGSCGHSCKLGVVDRDTASTRGEEAHCHVEAPHERGAGTTAGW